MTPRPCRGGEGVGSASLHPHTASFSLYHLLTLYISVLNITDPTPGPSPTGAGRHRVQHLLEHCVICKV